MTPPRRTRDWFRYRRFALTLAVIVVLVFAAAYLAWRH